MGHKRCCTFCSELYERVALIVTTNLKFADWTQVFGDECRTALLTMLTSWNWWASRTAFENGCNEKTCESKILIPHARSPFQ